MPNLRFHHPADTAGRFIEFDMDFDHPI
jgi:hypothetical protein